MAKFSITCLKRPSAQTAMSSDCIYRDNGHIDFMKLARSMLPVPSDVYRQYSRPGKTQFNVKFCGAWPSKEQCQRIWSALNAIYPDYVIQLSFNSHPHKRVGFAGLVVSISVQHEYDITKRTYECPYDKADKARAATAASKQVRTVSVPANAVLDDFTQHERDIIAAIRAKRATTSVMSDMVKQSPFSAQLTNYMQCELNEASHLIKQIDDLVK